MGCEAVARIQYDVLENAVRAMNAAPHDAYWARRLVDLVRDPASALRLGSHLATAVARWAAHDPTFFVHERHLSEQLAVWAWPESVLEELEQSLALGDRSLEHLVLGRLWLALRQSPEASYYARAALHLREVGPELRVGAWHEAMCEALGVADPDELARVGRDLLDQAPPLARERALVAILRGAARTARWDLYDAHRNLYRIDHTTEAPIDSEVVRLDGQRAAGRFLMGARVALTACGSTMPAAAPASDYVTVVPPARSTPRPA
jgi:hypothetical protein